MRTMKCEITQHDDDGDATTSRTAVKCPSIAGKDVEDVDCDTTSNTANSTTSSSSSSSSSVSVSASVSGSSSSSSKFQDGKEEEEELPSTSSNSQQPTIMARRSHSCDDDDGHGSSLKSKPAATIGDDSKRSILRRKHSFSNLMGRIGAASTTKGDDDAKEDDNDCYNPAKGKTRKTKTNRRRQRTDKTTPRRQNSFNNLMDSASKLFGKYNKSDDGGDDDAEGSSHDDGGRYIVDGDVIIDNNDIDIWEDDDVGNPNDSYSTLDNASNKDLSQSQLLVDTSSSTVEDREEYKPRNRRHQKTKKAPSSSLLSNEHIQRTTNSSTANTTGTCHSDENKEVQKDNHCTIECNDDSNLINDDYDDSSIDVYIEDDDNMIDDESRPPRSPKDTVTTTRNTCDDDYKDITTTSSNNEILEKAKRKKRRENRRKERRQNAVMISFETIRSLSKTPNNRTSLNNTKPKTTTSLSPQEAVSKELDEIEKQMDQLYKQREYIELSHNEELHVNQKLRDEIQQLKEELQQAKQQIIIEKDKNIMKRYTTFDNRMSGSIIDVPISKQHNTDMEMILSLKREVKSLLQAQLLDSEQQRIMGSTISTTTIVDTEKQELLLCLPSSQNTNNLGRLNGQILNLQSKLKESTETITLLRNEMNDLKKKTRSVVIVDDANQVSVVEPKKRSNKYDLITSDDDVSSTEEDDGVQDHDNCGYSSTDDDESSVKSLDSSATTVDSTVKPKSGSSFDEGRAAYWKAKYEELVVKMELTENEHKNNLDDKDSQIAFLQKELRKQALQQQQQQRQDEEQDSKNVQVESASATTTTTDYYSWNNSNNGVAMMTFSGSSIIQGSKVVGQVAETIQHQNASRTVTIKRRNSFSNLFFSEDEDDDDVYDDDDGDRSPSSKNADLNTQDYNEEKTEEEIMNGTTGAATTTASEILQNTFTKLKRNNSFRDLFQ